MACAPRNYVYNRRLKTFHDVCLGLYLVCSVPFSFRALIIWTSGNVMSIVSITHAVIFSRQEVSRRRVARGTLSQISFQCTSFEITKKYICLLKIVKNSGHKL